MSSTNVETVDLYTLQRNCKLCSWAILVFMRTLYIYLHLYDTLRYTSVSQCWWKIRSCHAEVCHMFIKVFVILLKLIAFVNHRNYVDLKLVCS